MSHDVFISYAAENKAEADAACAIVEQRGIRCWISPRDTGFGTDYSASIIDAIDASRVVVLIFSSHANDSTHVKNEIERASSKGKAIIPVRLEEVLPCKELELHLSRRHWLDALTPPLRRHIERLADAIEILLRGDEVSRAAATQPAPQEEGRPHQRRRQGGLLRRAVWIVSAVAVALGVLVLARLPTARRAVNAPTPAFTTVDAALIMVGTYSGQIAFRSGDVGDQMMGALEKQLTASRANQQRVHLILDMLRRKGQGPRMRHDTDWLTEVLAQMRASAREVSPQLGAEEHEFGSSLGPVMMASTALADAVPARAGRAQQDLAVFRYVIGTYAPRMRDAHEHIPFPADIRSAVLGLLNQERATDEGCRRAARAAVLLWGGLRSMADQSGTYEQLRSLAEEDRIERVSSELRDEGFHLDFIQETPMPADAMPAP
jgi:hypothetical protein